MQNNKINKKTKTTKTTYFRFPKKGIIEVMFSFWLFTLNDLNVSWRENKYGPKPKATEVTMLTKFYQLYDDRMGKTDTTELRNGWSPSFFILCFLCSSQHQRPQNSLDQFHRSWITILIRLLNQFIPPISRIRPNEQLIMHPR